MTDDVTREGPSTGPVTPHEQPKAQKDDGSFDLMDWGREEALFGRSSSVEFGRLGKTLTSLYGEDQVVSEEFDTTVLKQRVHRDYLEHLIAQIADTTDQRDLTSFLDKPTEFLRNNNGPNRLISILLNPANQVFLDQTGSSISFIELLRQYYRQLGLDFDIDISFRQIPQASVEDFIKKVSVFTHSQDEIESGKAADYYKYISQGGVVPVLTISKGNKKKRYR